MTICCALPSMVSVYFPRNALVPIASSGKLLRLLLLYVFGYINKCNFPHTFQSLRMDFLLYSQFQHAKRFNDRCLDISSCSKCRRYFSKGTTSSMLIIIIFFIIHTLILSQFHLPVWKIRRIQNATDCCESTKRSKFRQHCCMVQMPL